jgi:hypothetical protein
MVRTKFWPGWIWAVFGAQADPPPPMVLPTQTFGSCGEDIQRLVTELFSLKSPVGNVAFASTCTVRVLSPIASGGTVKGMAVAFVAAGWELIVFTGVQIPGLVCWS